MNYEARPVLRSIGKHLLLRDEGANLSIIAALAFATLAVAAGGAVEYAGYSRAREKLQSSLDSAVLAGILDPVTGRDATASSNFAGNIAAYADLAQAVPAFTTNADGSYSGNVRVALPTSFLGMIGLSTVTVGAASTATLEQVSGGGNALCLIALNPSIAAAINDSASSAVVAPNCIVQVNSSNTKAVSLSGSARINAAENCFVGGLSTSGSAGISPPQDPVCKPMNDPFANMTPPIVPLCTYFNYKPKSNEVLNPGVYCGGLTISSIPVQFSPGLYIIKDGILSASGGSQMTGSGVSFYLTGMGAGVNTSGGSSWHLTAMKTGALAGFVFYLDPNSVLAAKSSTVSGTSELYFDGVLYFGRQLLNLSGGSAAFATSPFTAYIADRFTLSGSSNLNIRNDKSASQTTIPAVLFPNGAGYRPRLAR